MKYIFLLFPFIAIAQINFSVYGAIGDGVTDDTAAIQTALDSESNLVANANSIFLISSRLDIDQIQSHNINWNNSTLLLSSSHTGIQIDKRVANGGVTVMNDLLIDGNNVGSIGMKIYTRVELTNIDVIDFTPSSSIPFGIWTLVFNDASCYGDWIFDGCDVNNIDGSGLNNNIIADANGAANGYYVQTEEIPSSPTKLIFKNATIQNCYAEDSQNMFVTSPSLDITNSNVSYEFDNLIFQGWERRSLKLFSGNLTFKNCTVYADLESNKTGIMDSAGMIAIGTGSGGTGSGNNIFENCDFIGIETGSRDNRVIMVNTDGVKFNNCNWSLSADLAITANLLGDVFVCNNNFGIGSALYDYAESSDSAEIFLDTDNVYADGVSAIQFDVFSYIETNLICEVIPPIEILGSKSVKTFFKLIN